MNIKVECLTIKSTAKAILVCAFLAWAAFTLALESPSNVSNRESRVTVEGTARIYGKWDCGGPAMVEAFPGDILDPIPGFPGGIQSAMITVPVSDIGCADGIVSKYLRMALKQEDHPKIYFEMQKYTLKDNHPEAKAVGEFTIAGVARQVELDVKLAPILQGGVRILGELEILMTDYDVKPPSPFWGIEKVKNNVTVKFDLAIRPPDPRRGS